MSTQLKLVSSQEMLDNWQKAELAEGNELAALKAAVHGVLFVFKITDRPDFAEIMERISYLIDCTMHPLVKSVYELAQEEAKDAVKFWLDHGPLPGDKG